MSSNRVPAWPECAFNSCSLKYGCPTGLAQRCLPLLPIPYRPTGSWTARALSWRVGRCSSSWLGLKATSCWRQRQACWELPWAAALPSIVQH